MKVQVNTKKVLGPYVDPTRWMNSTLRYVPFLFGENHIFPQAQYVL